MNKPASVAKIFDSIKTSFWFIPSLMVLGSIFSALLFAYFDRHDTFRQSGWLDFLLHSQRDTLRSLVNTIAGSMITVTSIAFSITIVTLTVASSQFGPRLIRNFMDDKGTQVVLGTFIASFCYCVVFVYSMSLEVNSQNRFLLTTLWCLLATLFSVAVLIYFIHHVAQAIQADNIIDDVFCDLKQGVYGLKRSSSGENCPVPDPSWVKQHFSHRQVITSTSQGYVQIVDKQALIDIAKQCDGVIDFTARPGDMLVVGAQVAVVYSKGALSDDIKTHINGHFLCGSSRTPIQDPEYAIHQMVEIAVRALSPSMNDPYTAITCIDKLSVILVELANGSLPSGCSYDDNDQLRLLYRTYEYDGLARASFDQIRQFGATSVAVTIRLLESLERLASHSDKQQVRQFVVQQGEAIEQLHHTHPFCPIDEQDFQASLGQLKRLVHD